MTNSECKKTEEKGRGGGIFLYFEVPITNFTLTEFQFEGNVAHIGKNISVKSNNLVPLVSNDKFGLLKNFELPLRENTFYGSDSSFLDISLYIFLDGYKGKDVYVGIGGGDVSYCGRSVFPCSTIPGGISRFEEGTSKQLITSTTSESSTTLSLSNRHVTSSTPSSFAPFTLTSSLTGDGNSGISNTGSLSFEFISFSFPYFLASNVKSLLSSSGTLLDLEKCSFSLYSTPHGLSFSLLSVSEGQVSVKELSFEPSLQTPFSSNISPFSLSTQSSILFKQCHF
jgi:hypothetical protein